MRWWLYALAAVLIGVAALGVWHAVNNPAFWAEAAALGASAIASIVLPKLLARNTPEVEAARRACERSGGRWDNFSKRCK